MRGIDHLIRPEEEADVTTQLVEHDVVADLVPFTATMSGAGRVILAGELDIGGLDALRSVLDQALIEPGDVIVDVGGLSFIDSRAIAELLRFQLVASAQGRALHLFRPSAAFTRIIDILDLGHILVAVDA